MSCDGLCAILNPCANNQHVMRQNVARDQHISLQTEISLEPFICWISVRLRSLWTEPAIIIHSIITAHWDIPVSWCHILIGGESIRAGKQFTCRNPMPVDESLILLSTVLSTTEINYFKDPENIKYAYEFQKLAVNQFMWGGNSSKGVLLSLQ